MCFGIATVLCLSVRELHRSGKLIFPAPEKIPTFIKLNENVSYTCIIQKKSSYFI